MADADGPRKSPMKDLTDSSIAKNILQMALPIAAGMFFQTLYFLIDLYFVAGLGDAAIAGVAPPAMSCSSSLRQHKFWAWAPSR